MLDKKGVESEMGSRTAQNCVTGVCIELAKENEKISGNRRWSPTTSAGMKIARQDSGVPLI